MPGHQPRTRHLNPDGTPKYTNRLSGESSPYLLQHAHNPVDWRPWGDEAFEAANELGRPVLLSVGYSTCHWCHVMEEESFEDLEIAAYMNEYYIAVKVDREERPDVDAIYMAALQAFSGRGGWPMTLWLTPERKPFYAGTYFPARDGDRGASVGFLTLLRRLREVYDRHPEDIEKNAEAFAQKISMMLSPPAGGDSPGAEVLDAAAAYYAAGFDPIHGGMRGAPKFPSNLPVRFLLRYHRRTGDRRFLEMAALTLEKMARGGMYDQVGGGFHRYSTDERWLVPHFEKMLYDNALLVTTYLEGYQATGRNEFAEVAREILRYIQREMTSPEGAFYSATDADSPNPKGEREEGWFFTWTPQELEEALGEERARALQAYYRVTPGGNFEGRNILSVPTQPASLAADLKLPEKQLRAVVAESRELLYAARSKRPAPIRDEKVLAAWNGLMISAHAFASLVLNEPGYAERAEKAADFVLVNLRQDGRLRRSHKDGKPRHNAYLDDYAFLTAAFIDLYESTGKPRWLREAIRLDAVLKEHYEDPGSGGFFLTSGDHEQLLARDKPAYDGAEPSGNSVAVMNLLRLHELTTDERYFQRADRALKAFGHVLANSPAALAEMLLALEFRLDTPTEILIVTRDDRTEAEPFLAKLRTTFLPNRVLAVVSELEDLEAHARLMPLLAQKVAREGKATAYVCRRGVCELPTPDPEVFASQIRSPGC